MALLEQVYHGSEPFTQTAVQCRYEELIEAAFGVVYSLEQLAGRGYPVLESVLRDIDTAISRDAEPENVNVTGDIVLPLESITAALASMVGSKAARLALISNQLRLPVPQGFVATSYAFKRFMEENNLSKPVARLLSTLSPPSSPNEMQKTCGDIRDLITTASVPGDIAEALMNAYDDIVQRVGHDVSLAMRSSAIGEDTEATFAGQYSTVLNVGREHVLDAYKTVIASKYSPKAVSYRIQYGLDDRETPMCVAGITMVKARSSGVMYTNDITSSNVRVLRINALWGLGEQLVDGSASPDTFLVDRLQRTITAREISRKEQRLTNSDRGGTQLENVPDQEKNTASLSDDIISTLTDYGLRIEEYFGGPQDIEWASDNSGKLFILQARPLRVQDLTDNQRTPQAVTSGYPVLFSGGKTASPGTASGKVCIFREGEGTGEVPDDCILVTRTASSNFARFAGRIRGIITDIGSTASHLGSVMREFGIPALFDAKNATARLSHGSTITLDASRSVIYQGTVDALTMDFKPHKNLIIESPIHQRTRRMLDRISPLNLTDPSHSSFSPEGCRTIHDVIRYTHEQAMKEMFDITEEADEVRSVQLTAKIPFILRLIDLGGGIRQSLTTCDMVTPDDMESSPMKALWKGFTHPGITWEGSVNFDAKNIMTLLASSATSEFGQQPGGASYAILTADYMNLSVKFGYHFAIVDTLCGENSSQNYISLQFSGGAGSYYGKSLRITLLGNILKRLGFDVALKGDLIEAFVTGYDRQSTEDKLDHMGRLLASSRLLDMTLSNQQDIEAYTVAFFQEDYDFLSVRKGDKLEQFYTHGGWWKRSVEGGRVFLLQDGARSGLRISSGVAGIMGKLVGQALQDFLDNIEAYYSFPLAIAKNSEMSAGTVSVLIKSAGGNIDRAGGIAFGIRNVSNYFVLRINALEDNIILFEYVNSERIQRSVMRIKIKSEIWYGLRVEVIGRSIKGFLDEANLIEYTAVKPVQGLVGLWTKADSVTYFDAMTILTAGHKRVLAF